MGTYCPSDLERGAQNVYSNVIAIYGLKPSRSIIKRVRELLKLEVSRRQKLPDSERGIDRSREAYKDDTIKTKKKAKKAKSKSPQRKGMFASLCELFDEKGINKVTLKEAVACALEAKPDSNLSKGHFAWYKKKYKDSNRQGKMEASLEGKTKKKKKAKKKFRRIKRK